MNATESRQVFLESFASQEKYHLINSDDLKFSQDLIPSGYFSRSNKFGILVEDAYLVAFPILELKPSSPSRISIPPMVLVLRDNDSECVAFGYHTLHAIPPKALGVTRGKLEWNDLIALSRQQDTEEKLNQSEVLGLRQLADVLPEKFD